MVVEEEDDAPLLLPSSPAVDSTRKDEKPWSSFRNLNRLAMLGLACSWLGVGFGFANHAWLTLDADIGFKNLGELHEFSLSAGLFYVEFSHVTKKRLNEVSRVTVSEKLDSACSRNVVLTPEGCDALDNARQFAFGAVAFLLSMALLNKTVLIIMAAVCGLFSAWLSRLAASHALATCVIVDPQARSELLAGGDSSLADLACTKIVLGPGSILLICASLLHVLSLASIRAVHSGRHHQHASFSL